MEIGAAFRAGEPAGTRALFILGGLVSVAFGVVLFAHPGIGAITLALLFGLYNLIYGTSALAQGIELRQTRKTLHSVLREKTAACAGPSAIDGTAAAARRRRVPWPLMC